MFFYFQRLMATLLGMCDSNRAILPRMPLWVSSERRPLSPSERRETSTVCRMFVSDNAHHECLRISFYAPRAALVPGVSDVGATVQMFSCRCDCLGVFKILLLENCSGEASETLYQERPACEMI